MLLFYGLYQKSSEIGDDVHIILQCTLRRRQGYAETRKAHKLFVVPYLGLKPINYTHYCILKSSFRGRIILSFILGLRYASP